MRMEVLLPGERYWKARLVHIPCYREPMESTIKPMVVVQWYYTANHLSTLLCMTKTQ